MKHAERRSQIEIMAREVVPYIDLSDDHLASVKQAIHNKLYAKGLSETAVRSWWRAIEARARVLAAPLPAGAS